MVYLYRFMETKEIVKFFEQHFQFKELSEKDCADLSVILEVKQMPRGQTIFKQNEVGESAYFIVSGLVRIFLSEMEEQKTLALIKNGGVLGELAIFDNQPRSAEAITVDDTVLLVFNRNGMMFLKKGNPDLAIRFFELFTNLICKRLRGTTRKMYGLF